jgi:hypothetical protein
MKDRLKKLEEGVSSFYIGTTPPGELRKFRGNLVPLVDKWRLDFVRIHIFPIIGFDTVSL